MSSGYYYTATSTPLAVPHKQQGTYAYAYPYQTAYGHLSESPPEPAVSSTGSGGASYDHSGVASTYASSDYASSESVSGVDLLEYMNSRLAAAYNPIPLDKSLAKQAKASGELNAKTRQLLELQALAQQKMLAAQASFSEGIKNAKEVQQDLQWSQKKVHAINQRAAQKYPAEYKLASQRYPAPADY